MAGVVIVTGGAGFIGSNIVHALAEQGRRVVVIDWAGQSHKWRNLVGAELYDFVHPAAFREYLQARDDVDAIVHMGAISSTTESDIDALVANNIRLTLDLWEWCGRRDVPFIYASSAATYGDGRHGFDDDWSPTALARLQPLNAYGWSKLAIDRRISRDVHEGGVHPRQWAGLRFFNVYGPNEYHKGSMRSVVHQMMCSIRKGEPVRLFKSYNPGFPDGGQLRDFIYVADCVEVVLWLLDTKTVSGIFNLGTGEARSFEDLARATYAAADVQPDIQYIEMPDAIRDQYQYFTQASVRRLREAGYQRPFSRIEKGVASYVTDYLLAGDSYL